MTGGSPTLSQYPDAIVPSEIDAYLDSYPPGDDEQLNLWLLENCAIHGSSSQVERALDLLSFESDHSRSFTLGRIADAQKDLGHESESRVAVVRNIFTLLAPVAVATTVRYATGPAEADVDVLAEIVKGAAALPADLINEIISAFPLHLSDVTFDQLMLMAITRSHAEDSRMILIAMQEHRLTESQQADVAEVLESLLSWLEAPQHAAWLHEIDVHDAEDIPATA